LQRDLASYKRRLQASGISFQSNQAEVLTS
jgi:hypothetical protein